MLSRLTNFSKSALVTLMNNSVNQPNVDSGKKVPASAKPISDRYQEAQREIISEMLADPIAIDNISRDLNIFEEDIYRKVAKSIINHYNDNGKLVVSALMDDDISDEVREVISTIAFSDLSKKFNQLYVDIMKCELPLEKEIKELDRKILQTTDTASKVSLAKEKQLKLKELQSIKQKYASKGGF